MERREYHNLSAKKCTRNLKIVYNDNGGIFVYIRQWSVIVLNTQAGKAAAKINLAIDVLKKRPDGYHDVSMIMQSVALFDTITVRAVKGDTLWSIAKRYNTTVDALAKLNNIENPSKVANGTKIMILKNIRIGKDSSL